jgi:hypothetical protein
VQDWQVRLLVIETEGAIVGYIVCKVEPKALSLYIRRTNFGSADGNAQNDQTISDLLLQEK